MIIDGMYIDNNTISTIQTNIDGTATLKFYQNTKVIFRKVYKDFVSARIAEGKLMKKEFSSLRKQV